MDSSTKWLLGLGLLGGAWWYWEHHGAAYVSLSAHAAIPAQMPEATGFPVTQAMSPPIAVAQAQAPVLQQSGQMTALLNWALGTKNPPLYQQMISQLDAQDLASLYDIMTTFWAGVTSAPTAGQTQFWNYLRGLYPFLNKGGVGCSNFACT